MPICFIMIGVPLKIPLDLQKYSFKIKMNGLGFSELTERSERRAVL